MSEPFQPVPFVYSPKAYPVLAFLVRYGQPVAWLVGLVPLLVAVLLFFYGFPAWTLLAGAGASSVVIGLLLSYVELVRVIDDTLLPK